MRLEGLKQDRRQRGEGVKVLSTKIPIALSPGKLNRAVLSEGQRIDMKLFPKLWKKGCWEGME